MLIIYGADLSPASNKVRFAANALGLEYEYRKVSIKNKENQSPDFLAMNPAGKIPVINDDGFLLFESNAILQYLAQKNDSDLYPTDLKQRAIVNQWMCFVTIHVGGAMEQVVFHRVFAPRIPLEPDQKAINEGERLLNRFLPVVENQLSKERFLAGQRLTPADINLPATIDAAETGGVILKDYAALSRWRETLQKKDFYNRCHQKYGEHLDRIMGATGSSKQ